MTPHQWEALQMMAADAGVAGGGIQISLEDRELNRRLVRLANAFPREAIKALQARGRVIRSRALKAVKNAGGEPLSPVTKALHPGRKVGGRLQHKMSMRCTKPARFIMEVDWLVNLRRYGSLWQTGTDDNLADSAARHAIYRILGARGARELFPLISPDAVQPSRPVFDELREQEKKDAPKAVFAVMAKLIRDKLSGKGGKRWWMTTPRT